MVFQKFNHISTILKYGSGERTYIIGGFEHLNHISTRFEVNPTYRVGGGGGGLNIPCWGGSGGNPSLLGGGGIKLVHKIKLFQKFRLRLIYQQLNHSSNCLKVWI